VHQCGVEACVVEGQEAGAVGCMACWLVVFMCSSFGSACSTGEEIGAAATEQRLRLGRGLA
jgi:hypothetical protein